MKDSEIIENRGSVEEPRYFNRFGEELRCRKPERPRGPPSENGGLFR